MTAPSLFTGSAGDSSYSAYKLMERKRVNSAHSGGLIEGEEEMLSFCRFFLPLPPVFSYMNPQIMSFREIWSRLLLYHNDVALP